MTRTERPRRYRSTHWLFRRDYHPTIGGVWQNYRRCRRRDHREKESLT